jgi:hypothetical protein
MTWPQYDTPERVEDVFGSYTEIITPGAADDAEIIPGDRCMIVAKDEWNEDFSVRTIWKISAISREGEG